MKGSELPIDDQDQKTLEQAAHEREVKLEELRRQFEHGEYNPDAAVVANRLIREQEAGDSDDRI